MSINFRDIPACCAPCCARCAPCCAQSAHAVPAVTMLCPICPMWYPICPMLYPLCRMLWLCRQEMLAKLQAIGREYLALEKYVNLNFAGAVPGLFPAAFMQLPLQDRSVSSKRGAKLCCTSLRCPHQHTLLHSPPHTHYGHPLCLLISLLCLHPTHHRAHRAHTLRSLTLLTPSHPLSSPPLSATFSHSLSLPLPPHAHCHRPPHSSPRSTSKDPQAPR